MSLARAISRGRALKARFAVNGMKKASRSFGTAAVTDVFCAAFVAWAIACLVPEWLRPHPEEHREAMRLEGWGRPRPSRRGLRPLLRMRAARSREPSEPLLQHLRIEATHRRPA